MERSLVCLLAAACASGACGGAAEWSPAGVGPAEPASSASLSAAEALPIALDNDLAGLPAEGTGVVEADASGAEPRVMYLFYADGSPTPAPAPGGDQRRICPATPPAFVCTWNSGGVEACKHAVQAFLDVAYQDFNLIFTFRRPTSGRFYTVVVTSDGGWCTTDPNIGGITPATCDDFNGGTAYALQCKTFPAQYNSANVCAVIIAHEHGHLVGLMHTDGTSDIMRANTCPGCAKFENNVNTASPMCRTTQNSYQMMLDRLGAWPGGAKPDPFVTCSDNAPPTVTISAPANGATVGQSFDVTASASDDCSGVVSSRITIGALSAPGDGPGPWTWPINGLTGNLVIKVEATDAKGKVGSTSIIVAGPGSLGVEWPDGSVSQPDGSESQTDGEVVVEPPPPPSPRSCGCALGARAASPGAAALLVTGAALARRRRGRRAVAARR